jgi:hypothetical protein
MLHLPISAGSMSRVGRPCFFSQVAPAFTASFQGASGKIWTCPISTALSLGRVLKLEMHY